MKKLYIITLLSVMAGTVCADAPDLTDITQAIEEADIIRVKRHWRKIDRSHDRKEKQEALEELLETTADIAAEQKSSVTSGSGKNYYKLVPGGLLYAIGTGGAIGGILWSNTGVRRDDMPAYIALFIGSMASIIGGQYLFKSGWNTDAQQAGDHRSKFKVIETYLEDALDQLDEEAAEE